MYIHTIHVYVCTYIYIYLYLYTYSHMHIYILTESKERLTKNVEDMFTRLY
jgi:hypothetical protein